jgi:ketosteroid isomerase-like protein
MTDGAFQTVHAAYAAFVHGDADAILQLCTEDVDWGIETTSIVAPWYGIRHGHPGLAQFLIQVGEALEVLEFTPTTTVGSGEEVMTRVRFRARARHTGRDISTDLMHYFKFRDNRICFWRGSEDLAQTEQALRTPQAQQPIEHPTSGPQGQMSGKLSGQMSGQLFSIDKPLQAVRAASSSVLNAVRQWRRGKPSNR